MSKQEYAHHFNMHYLREGVQFPQVAIIFSKSLGFLKSKDNFD